MKKFIKLLCALSALAVLSGSAFVKSVADTNVFLGDVNNDKKIDASDLIVLRKYLAKNLDWVNFELSNADVDENEAVELKDVLYLKQYLIKKITDFSTVKADKNLLDNLENIYVEFENLGIPAKGRYSSYYARNIWDMAVKNGKVYITMGDYVSNSGVTPVYYFKNSSEKAVECGYRSYNKTYGDGLNTEAAQKFFVIDSEIYTASTDPIGMNNGSYYKLDSTTDNWQEYYNLAYNVHCYDMIEYDGKIFFGGMVRSPQNSNWITGCVQYVEKSKLTSSTSLTSLSKTVDFYYDENTPLTSESYVSDFDGKTYYRYDYWRVYNMFVFNGELYATHINTADYSVNDKSGLFKYDKENDRFIQVYNGKATKSLMSVLRNYTVSSNADKNGSYVSKPVPIYYSFEDNSRVEGELKKGIEGVYGEPILTASFSKENLFVCVCNDIFKSKDLVTFEKVSLGKSYENYVVRDAFELEGKYYFLASKKNDENDYTTCIFESDSSFSKFRCVLATKTESFARSFDYNDGYIYLGLGTNSVTAGLQNSSAYLNEYSGTVLRANLEDYLKY